jgi:hypothetical protein
MDPTILPRVVHVYVIADIDIGMNIHSRPRIHRPAKIVITIIPAAAIDGRPDLRR